MRRVIFLLALALSGCPDDTFPIAGHPADSEQHKKAWDKLRMSQCRGCGGPGEKCCKEFDCTGRNQDGCAPGSTCNYSTMQCDKNGQQ
jgi:hypothetical protein